MSFIGTGLLGLAILSSAVSAICYILVTRGHNTLLRWGRVGAWTALIATAICVIFLLALFLMQRYDVRYVYDFSSSDLETRYRISAIWAGLSGRLVVWALIGLGCVPFLMRRTRHFEPYVLALLLLLQAILLGCVVAANPFAPTEIVLDGIATGPADGRGLDPRLHSIWMMIQPPTLLAGYALLAVPCCMALAGLLRRDYDGWAHLAAPWASAGWTMLGLGLAMGGFWAYESLDGGGYRGWDPAASSALAPWLVGAALVHGLQVQRSQGGLRRVNFMLAILAYGGVLFASFLAGPAVPGSTSLVLIMLPVVVMLVSLGALLLLARWTDIPRRPASRSLLPRHTVVVLTILGFVLLGVAVGAGTGLSWTASIPDLSRGVEQLTGGAVESGGRRSAGLPFGGFALMPDSVKRVAALIALVLGVLMALGPLLGPRDTSAGMLLREARWPLVVAAAVAGASTWLGARDLFSIASVLIATFAIGTNGLMIVRIGRSDRLRIGGYLAHMGMAVLLAGVVGSSVYSSAEQTLVIPQGETQSVFGHDFTFWGYEPRPDGKHVLRLEVDKEAGAPFVASPNVYYNARMQIGVRTPAIRRYLWQDLYIAPDEYIPAEDANTATLVRTEQDTIGPYAVRFDRFEVDDHQMTSGGPAGVGATVTITHENSVEVVTPWLRVAEDGLVTSAPVPLANGGQLILEQISVGSEAIQLRITGLNLPVIPARAVLSISTRPAVTLIWLGTLLVVLGASVAVVRQWAGTSHVQAQRTP